MALPALRALPVLTSFLFLCATVHAGDGKPRFYSVTVEDLSPKRDLLIEHYRSDAPGFSPVPEQIWLVSTSDPSARRLLFAHERDASVLFSGDEEWLVINDHQLSNESHLLLFRRKGPLDYEQVSDLTDAAWRYFDQQQHAKAPHGFDHSYVEALRWAENDPPTLLLVLDGHLDSRNFTSEWYCLYNVRTGEFSVNFAAHNRQMTKLEGD